MPSAHQHTAPGANVRKFLPGVLLTILSRMSEGDREHIGSGTVGDRTKGASLGACQIRHTIGTVVPRGAHATTRVPTFGPLCKPGRPGAWAWAGRHGMQQRQDPAWRTLGGKIQRLSG